ncbi:MAG: hypothetical protein Q4C09_10870, partial [Atopobiaceae bacterium]|nr:hypothetical protein [Atopobiaceae bacterium]
LGWRAFLMNEIIKPYLPMLYPNVTLNGLAPTDPVSFMYLKGQRRHFTSDGRAYPSLLGKLALDVINASRNRAIKRIESLYDAIYIDEGQDLRGNDLCVLEKLLRSSITIHIVLDPRQSTLSTAQRDDKYRKKYPNAMVINLYRFWESKGLLSIDYLYETWRFTPRLALFSDLIFEPELNLGRTVSNVMLRGRHDGIYLIPKEELREYSIEHMATALTIRESEKLVAYESINIGLSKGMSRDDIVICATKPIEDLLIRGKRLSPSSACSLYVAVTRARYSVALAVTNPEAIAKAMRASHSIWKDVHVKLLTEEATGRSSYDALA